MRSQLDTTEKLSPLFLPTFLNQATVCDSKVMSGDFFFNPGLNYVVSGTSLSKEKDKHKFNF